MSKTVVVLPDPHAHPAFGNERADWAGQLIADLKPDTVVNLGDQWDMPSLSSYEKGTKNFIGRNYAQDIESGLEFSERLWTPSRKRKRKMPHRVFLEGNHEHRIKKAIQLQPELEGGSYGISFRDLDLESYYDDIVPYSGSTPGIIELDSVLYAHYFVSGLMGRPLGGLHPAASLVKKNHKSCVCGHSHLADWFIETTPDGEQIHGLVAGVFQDYDSDWAGVLNRKWWRGLVVLNEVESGSFTPRFVSLPMLQREYGK